MPGACPNYWQEYGCEWSIRYLWHWANLYTRLDLVVLALLLAYVLAIAIRVSRRYHLARCAQETDDIRTYGELAVDLNVKVSRLRSIGSIAPYLGLVGTCLGLLSLFESFVLEKHAAQAMLVSKASASLLAAAAGILVAIPTTCFYNYLRTRIDLLEIEISREVPVSGSRYSKVAHKFLLGLRCSAIPFPLVAASSLAILVGAVFMGYSSDQTSAGLSVSIVPTNCEYEGDDRLIVLRLTDSGKLLINQTQEDWSGLSEVLSKIYGSREHRTLYLLAEDGVPFQTVADVLDVVENANVEPHQAARTEADKLDIMVRLITPEAMKSSCVLEPVGIGSSRHVPR